MTIEEILSLIITDPTRALICIEALKAAGTLTSEQWKKISKKFKQAQKLKKFGCTPSNELADSLRKIDSTPKFCKLQKLIGNHPSLRLARIGLYLETLNEKGQTEIVEKIRGQIFENHGEAGIQFLDIGSSGLMSEVIDSLENINIQFNLSQYDLVKRYEYIIRKMNYITIYIDNEQSPQNIELKISQKMEQYPQDFYAVATGLASDKTMQVIAKMSNQKKFQEKGYMFFSPNIRPQGDARKQYIWTFSRFL